LGAFGAVLKVTTAVFRFARFFRAIGSTTISTS
jgi:hypothetical protein